MSKQNPFDVARLLPAVQRYARVLTRSGVEADDLAQEALLRAYEKRRSFDGSRPLLPWLLSIVHNLFIDRTRRRSTEARVHDTLSAMAALLPPAMEADTRLRLQALLAGFEALPDEQRAALHLVVIEGLSYQEAATTLDIPVGTLMSRLARARGALRALDSADPLPARPLLKLVRGEHD